MGKHRSDDSDGDYPRRSKKKKKRRSRSSSDSESSHSRKARRKHRKSSRSRSRSAVKRRTHASWSSRRSRSSSTDRHSNSRTHRSVSRTSDRWGSSRRSRSPPSRHGRSHSRSPSRKHNTHRHRSRSLSHSHRRLSRSHSKGSRSFSGERSHSQRHQPSSDNKPAGGFSEVTPSEQADERMRQAFKAAAAAGEKLKVQAVPNSSLLESQNFAASVAAIDSDEFVASSFKSSRSNKIKDEPADGGYNHDDAIFGSLAISGFTLTPDPDNKPIQFDGDSIVHPSLFCDPQEKMEKWITRLTQLRKRRLEGDVL